MTLKRKVLSVGVLSYAPFMSLRPKSMQTCTILLEVSGGMYLDAQITVLWLMPTRWMLWKSEWWLKLHFK